MRFAFLISLFLFSRALFGQVDSLQIVCQKQVVNRVDGQDLLWMFRQRDTLQHPGPRGVVRLVIDERSITRMDSLSLRYSASLSQEYPALDSIWYPVLADEIQAFNLLQDSLQIRINQLGWTMRYLQTARNLKRQQQLISSGRSQVQLSFHNFDLAADVGLYFRRKYLKRSSRYLRLGQEAKNIGLFWGGDFVGFPDPGHVQRFVNSSAFIEKYPFISFEFERYRNAYQQIYQKKKSLGRVDLVKDTEALLISMNRQRIGKVCACQYAIIPAGEYPLGEEAKVLVNTQQNWVFIQPKDTNGYYYSLGRWAYRSKN